MKKILITIASLVLISLVFWNPVYSKDKETVNWISFEQLEDSLRVSPKKVIIDFYTDWCSYCLKMDKAVYSNPEIAKIINSEYYAVKFNAETDKVVRFGSNTFINDQIAESRKPIHQIARILGSQKGNFTPPAIIILDEDFTVINRYFEFIDSERFKKVLNSPSSISSNNP